MQIGVLENILFALLLLGPFCYYLYVQRDRIWLARYGKCVKMANSATNVRELIARGYKGNVVRRSCSTIKRQFGASQTLRNAQGDRKFVINYNPVPAVTSNGWIYVRYFA